MGAISCAALCVPRGAKRAFWSVLGLLAVAGACSDSDGESANTGEEATAFPTPDLFPQRKPGVSEAALRPCARSRSGAGPQIPFSARRDRELYLLLGSTPEQLAFDYRVPSPFRMASVELRYDFDRTTSVAPLMIEEDCPVALPFETVRQGLPAEGVFTASVTARDALGQMVRQARVSFASGSRTLRLELPEVPEGAGAAWVIFEPAEGKGRIALGPAEWGDTVTVEGLPSGGGEIAVVGSRLITPDREQGAAYVRAGFGESWRFGVSPWYGAIVSAADGETAASVGDSPDAGTVSLRRMKSTEDAAVYFNYLAAREELSAERPSVLTSFSGNTRAGNQSSMLQAPCDASAIAVHVMGFGRVTSGELEAGPGETLRLEVDCAGDDEFVAPLSVRSVNQRLGALLVELEFADSSSPSSAATGGSDA